MSNTITNVKEAGSIICKMAAGRFQEKPLFINEIEKEPYDTFKGKNGYKSGASVEINVPPIYTAGTSFDITSAIQDTVETTKTLPLNITSTVAMEIDSLEIAKEMDLKNFMERHGNSAIDSIAADVEGRVLEKCTDAVYQSVGTAGSETFEFDTFAHAQQKMNEALAPDEDRCVLLNAAAMRSAMNSAKGYLNPQTGISKMYEDGFIRDPITGFKFLRNELVNRHTNGTDVAFEVRTTVSIEGQATLVVEGLTATTGTVTKGTVFTVDTVFDVDPLTKTTLPTLKQFVVTALATADGDGYATLDISPAIYTSASAGLQSVSAFPADGDTCNVVGVASTSYAQNLAFNKKAFRFVSAPLEMPKNAELIGQETVGGITVALIRDFDVLERKWVTRFDVLCGVAAVRENWACRITA